MAALFPNATSLSNLPQTTPPSPPPPKNRQVKLKEAARYLAASEEAARQLANQTADRAFQRQFASRSLAPANPALRSMTDTAAAAGDAGASGSGGGLRIGMGPVQRGQQEDPELQRLRLLVGGGSWRCRLVSGIRRPGFLLDVPCCIIICPPPPPPNRNRQTETNTNQP